MKLLSPPVVVIALCATVPAHADTITLAALEGYVTILPSRVTEGPYSPDAFGTFVGQIGHFQSGTPLLPWESRSIFEFDLGAIDLEREMVQALFGGGAHDGEVIR